MAHQDELGIVRMTAALLPLLSSLAYLIAAITVSQRLFHPEGPHYRLLFSAATLGVLFHAMGLSQSIFADGGQNFSLVNVTSLVCWLISGCFTFIAIRTPIYLLLPIVYGVACLIQLMVTLLPSHGQLLHIEQSPALLLHIVVAFLAYAMLIMATLYSFQVSYISHRLKQKAMLGSNLVLPALMPAERLLFRLVVIGTSLLGMTLVSGMLFSADFFAKQNLHKNLLSLLAFLTYGLLLLGHHRYGWRGRIANAFAICGAILMTLAYFGSRFVREVVLDKLS